MCTDFTLRAAGFGLPVILEGSKTRTFNYATMSIALGMYHGIDCKGHELSCCVIMLNDLHLLIDTLLVLDYGDLKRTSAEITIHTNTDAQPGSLLKSKSNSLQQKLLGPFAKLHTIRHFTITGIPDSEYVQYITQQALKDEPHFENVLPEVLHLEEQGDHSLKDHRYHLAIPKYNEALRICNRLERRRGWDDEGIITHRAVSSRIRKKLFRVSYENDRGNYNYH